MTVDDVLNQVIDELSGVLADAVVGRIDMNDEKAACETVARILVLSAMYVLLVDLSHRKA